MGRFRAMALALVLGLLATATLSACGESEDAELLPGKSASQINANLDLVEDLVANGECEGAENAAAAVSLQVEELSGVDQELKETLGKGAAKLEEVIGECSEAPEEDEETVADEEAEQEELEKQEQDEEKEDRKAEKEADKEAKQEEKSEKEPPSKEPPDQEPKEEESEVPPTEESSPPSGGVSPSTEAGGAE
jgi:outer membrane biosynthesis protein TonB